jgi:hypothetical protein
MEIFINPVYDNSAYMVQRAPKSKKARNADPVLPQTARLFGTSNESSQFSYVNLLRSSLRPSKYVKRTGHSLRPDRDGVWDTFAVARFVDLVCKTTGSTLDARAILQKYDLNGDGVLSREEQSAMVEALTASERPNEVIASASILNDALQNEKFRPYAQIRQAARRYERMFWYDDTAILGA